jgi:hypothetical protein
MKVSRKTHELFMQKSIHRTKLDGPLQGSNRLRLPFRPTPKRPMIISPSEIAAFLRCRLQWNWRYRVGIESRKMAQPRANGIFVHAGKEGWYELPRQQRTAKSMRRMAKQAIAEQKLKDVKPKDRDLALAMLVGYAQWVNGDHDKSDRAIGKRTFWPEWEFVLPLVPDKSILVRGKIDELFEPTIYKNTLAMDETKTKNNISFDMLDMNYQMTTYLWAMSTKYPKYKRYIAWRTVLRRMMPGPRVKAPLFDREFVERSDDDLKMWHLDIQRTVTDMLDAAIYPTPNDSCRWNCDFYNLCLVRSNRHDLKEIIEAEYTVK